MEPTVEQLQQQIDALREELAKFSGEHAEFRSVHVSRRGVAGGRGETGAPGRDAVGIQGNPGPEGRPGRDANISECVAAAKVSFESEITALHSRLGSVVLQALKDAGVVDSNGKAILVAGPAGLDGQNSTVAGPAGRDGESITGPTGTNGRDAQVVIGTVSAGDQAAASVRVVDGVSYLDIVLPRGEKGESIVGTASTVAGPAGKDGKDAFVTPGDIAHLESKFRNIWKSDFQVALRAHFNESHNDASSKS